MTVYPDYQSIEWESLPPNGMSNESEDEIRRDISYCWCHRRILLGILIIIAATTTVLFTDNRSSSLYASTVRLGSQQDYVYNSEHHEHHHHHTTGFTKLVFIHKDYENHHQQHEKKKKNHKENTQTAQVSVDKLSGEIGGYIDVNKTCDQAFSTPFTDFGRLFYYLVGENATRLDHYTWAFTFGGHDSVEFVKYNDKDLILDVVIVQGFAVFEAFHEVFAFKQRHHGGCRIHRNQYLILKDGGPVSWDDMVKAGKAELDDLYSLLGS